MKDQKDPQKNNLQLGSEKLTDIGSDGLTSASTVAKSEASGSLSGSDPNFEEKKTRKRERKKGEDPGDLEMKIRWKNLAVGDLVSYVVRDHTGQQIGGHGKILAIYSEGKRKAVHVAKEPFPGKEVLLSADEVTSVVKPIEVVQPLTEESQPILPGTIKLDDAMSEMISRRSTWDEALGELEAFDALMDERRKTLKDLRSKVKECRKLYVQAKRTVRSLGGVVQ